MKIATMIEKIGPHALNASIAGVIKTFLNSKMAQADISHHAVTGGTKQLVNFQSAANLAALIIASNKMILDKNQNSIVLILDKQVNGQNTVAVLADCKFNDGAIVVKTAYVDTSAKWGVKIPAITIES